MDAKVLRAAVSAAVRVTISTSVIGCGAVVSSDPGPATSEPAPGGEHPSAPSSPTAAGSPGTTLNGAAAGAGGTTQGGATAASGGHAGLIEPGGAESEAGASGGDTAAAGAPATETCGSDVEACLATLAEAEPSGPLSSAQLGCCQRVLDGLAELGQARAECHPRLTTAFMSSPAHQACCAELQAWQQQACTPWGPPVPPDLSLARLRAWEAAA